jgi:hypothetical protein
MFILTSAFRKSFPQRIVKMAINQSSSEVESVVERCTRKISESLQPIHLSVTSSNDDPNGSHVSY